MPKALSCFHLCAGVLVLAPYEGNEWQPAWLAGQHDIHTNSSAAQFKQSHEAPVVVPYDMDSLPSHSQEAVVVKTPA
jgi:hypothetical protein